MTFRFISAAFLMAAMIPVRMAGAETGDDGSVALDGPGDSYIFKNVRCSEVDLGKVTVDGRAFNPERDRLSVYGNSAIVIADGWTDPLTIYKEEECKGESMVLDFDRYYRSDPKEATNFLPEEELGSFDNAIRSFRLKNGFMCTMANNPDGTGYSRVFIASDGDLVVNEMPEGLAYVSFVRVCRHDWIGKR
ncbi:MAG: hypothetical protein K2F63_04040, partial [Muribaculaceae bacterium]|nr:hypothetical protein [Muribaculaceae bacterium]